MPLCYSLIASRASVLLSHLDFHVFEDETVLRLCLLLRVHANSEHQGKAGGWVSGGQAVPWQDSRCRWSAQPGPRQTAVGSPPLPPSREGPHAPCTGPSGETSQPCLCCLGKIFPAKEVGLGEGLIAKVEW